jgi:hypothetical protein
MSDLVTAQVSLGRETVALAEYRFRVSKRALPLLQAMGPRLATGQLGEADFDVALQLIEWASAETARPITIEQLNALPIKVTELTAALDQIARLNQWIDDGGAAADPKGLGGRGPSSTPT